MTANGRAVAPRPPFPADMGSIVFCASGCLNENKNLNKRNIEMRASTSAKSSSGRRSGDKVSKTPTKRSLMQYEERPFFFGKLSLKDDQHDKKHWVVTDVFSVVEGYADDIQLAWIRKPASVRDGEYVIGLKANSGPIVFFNDGSKYAVQLLMWSDFKESDSEPSLEKYLGQHRAGSLSAKYNDFEIIGNENVPGHILLTDGVVYVKGFFSYGDGVVKYAEVFKYNRDFRSNVAERNQATEMVYHGTHFTILVPQKWSPSNKHSVIDCEDWVPLVERHQSEESQPRDVSKCEDMETDPQQREISCDDGWDAEMAFLSVFDKYVKDCGFTYETADLVRLHTSVKCSMCTLLAGSPGTGKSSLAELYMRAVAGSPEEKDEAKRSWRQIFVNPAWMEPADLLGYETDTGFRHAPSRLVDFIRNISEGENKPMGIACFEEMNLACVEHYFSDFIQIMSRGYGVIPGCRENGRDLSVGCNFRVIGTCNSDETTRPLSPRFLSRCNTIELSSSFETTKSLVEDLAKGKTPEIKPFTNSIPITYEDFKRWYESSYARTIDNGIIKAILFLLKQPNEGDESIMSVAGFDMSGRIVSDLFAYIRNRPPYTGEISDNGEAIRLLEVDRQKVALDEFLAQRVFFACRPTPGTITDIKTLRDTVDNQILIKKNGKDVSIGFKLPLSASLLTRRIADYTKRVMQG